MAIKKVTLKGRKRLGELGQVEALTEKKSELMALQETVVAKAKVAAVAANTSAKTASVATWIGAKRECTFAAMEPKAKAAKLEQIASELITWCAQLRSAGTSSWRQYTEKQVKERLLAALAELVNREAARLLSEENLTGAPNQHACQAYLDALVTKLNEVGLQVGHLKLMRAM